MKREARLLGVLAVTLGLVSLATGLGLLAGGSAPATTSGLHCKALCGWTRLITELFGTFAGSLVGAALWLLVGAAFTLVGYRLLRE